MSREIRGRHILGGIALAALVSLPFDAMIVSGMLTEIRMERAFRAADARAAKRAHDRALADTVSAAPQPDQSALISRATAPGETTDPGNTTDQAEEGSAEPVFSQAGHSEAGAAAESGVGAVSHPAPRNRSSWSARSSSSSTLQGRGESAEVASAQSVRSERSPLETHRRTVLSGSEQKASGGRSYQQMADNAAKICGLSEPEDQAMFRRLIQRESEWNPEAVSASGAIGLAQVMPRSAISPTLDVRDPWQNLVAGACLLRQYRDRFGSWRVALHAYHGGPTRVDRRRVARSSRNYAQDVIGGNE